jgi:hypothetical protein
MKAVLFLSGILVLALGGIAVWMGATQTFCPPPRTPEGIDSPVLAMELARTANEVRGVLRDPDGGRNREVMRGQVREDWPFIACYWACFSGIAAAGLRSSRRRVRAAAVVALLAATGAAAGDVVEDLGMLRQLRTDADRLTDAMAEATRTASLIKWGLLAATEAVLGLIFWSSRGAGTAGGLARVVGAVLVLASAFGFAGLKYPEAIPWSVGLLSVGLTLALPLLVIIPGRFLEGLGAAPGAPGPEAA